VALRCVYQACRAVTIPVIGLGGIGTAEDALEFILVGASAVQVGTANFLRPDQAFRIVDALPDALRAARCDDFASLRGTLTVE